MPQTTFQGFQKSVTKSRNTSQTFQVPICPFTEPGMKAEQTLCLMDSESEQLLERVPETSNSNTLNRSCWMLACLNLTILSQSYYILPIH